MDKKKNLYQIAEEAAYSSKGHFKTADWIKISLMLYIGVPLVTSVILLIFQLGDMATRILSFFGFLFSIIAMTSVAANNRDKTSETIKKHMDLGNKYLDLHKQVRVEATKADIDTSALTSFTQKIAELDRETADLHICFAGRLWSKMCIKKEMDLDWLYK